MTMIMGTPDQDPITKGNIMRKIIQWNGVFTLALASSTSLMTACQTDAPSPPLAPPPLAGFQCLPIPSIWMEPGSIFSVDSQGTSFRIGKADGITGTAPEPAGFPAYSATSDFNVGFLLSTLSKLTARTGWDAQVGANSHKGISIVNSYANPSLSITEGQPESKAIEWFTGNHYRIEEGRRYYLVREALLADNATYEIKRDDITKLSADASVKDMIKAKLEPYNNSSNSAYMLKTTFDKKLNVCIKPRELIILSEGANGGQMLASKAVTTPIQVSDVSQP